MKYAVSAEEIRQTEERLVVSPALEFILALARHRAAMDHRNQKLTKPEAL